MVEKKQKVKQPGIFRRIRKPTAPPTIQIGHSKPLEKRIPSGRKSKHKKKIEVIDGNI